MDVTPRPSRLIEVALPFQRVAAATWHEKTIASHPSLIHRWWARRPLVESRAIVLASLLPDPADPVCPEAFRQVAVSRMAALHARGKGRLRDWRQPAELREALVDFIAEYARWESSEDPDYLEASRSLIAAAHEALRGSPGLPLVVDPFAGGGSIPLEALRLGARTFASDLNPVAVLIEKVVLEDAPRYGRSLAEDLRRAGKQIGEEAATRLASLYPESPPGAPPLSCLWARVIRCECCGTQVPTLSSLWLARRHRRSIALQLVPAAEAGRIDIEIIEGVSEKTVGEGTMHRGEVTCPVCGFKTSLDGVRAQMRAQGGGAATARMLCVVEYDPGSGARRYRRPEPRDLEAAARAADEVSARERQRTGRMSFIPDEEIAIDLDEEEHRLGITRYGMVHWRELFTPRQLLSLATLAEIIHRTTSRDGHPQKTEALRRTLAFALDRVADSCSSLAKWVPRQEAVAPTFVRVALPMTWEFAEQNPWASTRNSWASAVESVARGLEALSHVGSDQGQAALEGAAYSPLPDGSADAIITDPPYFNVIPYANLSDFFYVWLRRALSDESPLFAASSTPRAQEVIGDRRPRKARRDEAYYRSALGRALVECRRVLRRDGLCVLVFASRSLETWGSLLQTIIDAGWMVTASWPIDMERADSLSARGRAFIDTSVHLVCRPRDAVSGSTAASRPGGVLSEMRMLVRDRMIQLAVDGVVGSDAFFVCLGPALALFCRHVRVEDPDGELISLQSYMERIWEAVIQESLARIFGGATEPLEADARLTVAWLWMLYGKQAPADTVIEENERSRGFVLEHSAAQILARAVGIAPEEMSRIVQLHGRGGRLLSVEERMKARSTTGKGRGLSLNLDMPPDHEAARSRSGATTLDRVHGAMLLLGKGETAALDRFLAGDGGGDGCFWRLAQVLATLYPRGTSERHQIEGVLTRRQDVGL